MKKYWIILFALPLLMSCGDEGITDDTKEGDTTGLSAEVQETISNLKALVSGMGKITSSETDSQGVTRCMDSKGNTIVVDASGNALIVKSNGDSIIVDNTIKETTKGTADKRANTRWMVRIDNDYNYDDDDSPSIYDVSNSVYYYLRSLGDVQLEEAEVVVDTVEESYDKTLKGGEVEFYNSTCSYTQHDTLAHFSVVTREVYKKVVIPEQFFIGTNNYFWHIYQEGKTVYVNYYDSDNGWTESTKMKFNVPYDGYLWVGDDFSELKSKRTNKTIKVRTEYYNYTRISKDTISVQNANDRYMLVEFNADGIPEMEVYKWGSDKWITDLVSIGLEEEEDDEDAEEINPGELFQVGRRK